MAGYLKGFVRNIVCLQNTSTKLREIIGYYFRGLWRNVHLGFESAYSQEKELLFFDRTDRTDRMYISWPHIKFLCTVNSENDGRFNFVEQYLGDN
jgi:hypothetical protein